MKDGIYDFHFNALSKDHAGSLVIRENLAEGGDAVHHVRGQLSRAGSNILASFDVVRHAVRDHPDEAGSSQGYALKMFGTGSDTQFSVIGLAPLGLIVEFSGTWQGPLPADAGGRGESIVIDAAR